MDASQAFSPRLPIRNDVIKNLSTSPAFQEAVKAGNWRGQTVTTDTRAQSPIIAAAARVSQTLRTDLATLARRVTRQGQAVSSQAAKRLTAQYDKLPNMPDMAAIHSLVSKFQTYVDAMEQREDARGERRESGEDEQGAAVADAAANMFSGAGEQISGLARGGSGESGGQDSQGGDSSRQGPSPDDIFKALQDFDSDVTHQFAALDVVREHFASTNAPEAFQEALAGAVRAFEAPEFMRDIRAGYAAAKIAADEAETLETNPGVVRDTYRTLLREEQNFGQLFDSLSTFDMSKKFNEVISTFQSVVGVDLDSAKPSMDKLFLGALMTELGKLKTLKSVVGASELICARLQRLVPEREKAFLDPADLTSRMLHYAAKPVVKLDDARGLLGKMADANAESQVQYANGLRELHGEIPDAVLPTSQARPQQSSVLMMMMDDLVAAEEELLSLQDARAAPAA